MPPKRRRSETGADPVQTVRTMRLRSSTEQGRGSGAATAGCAAVKARCSAQPKGSKKQVAVKVRSPATDKSFKKRVTKYSAGAAKPHAVRRTSQSKGRVSGRCAGQSLASTRAVSVTANAPSSEQGLVRGNASTGPVSVGTAALLRWRFRLASPSYAASSEDVDSSPASGRALCSSSKVRQIHQNVDNPAVPEAQNTTAGPCHLFSLPSAVLGRIWPAERVVMGLRVCRQLRQDLCEHAGSVLLAKRVWADTSKYALSKDFRRLSRLKVELRWHGNGCLSHPQPVGPGLMCVGSLGAALIRVDLSYSGIGPEKAERLVRALRRCKALAHLELCENYIGNRGAGRLAKVLGEWEALTYLGLCENSLDSEGAGKLAGVLGECKALAHLDLSENEIGAEGARRLADVLGKCKTLAHLNLIGNEIGSAAAGRLAGLAAEHGVRCDVVQ